jgi:hypothetical protein
MANRPITYTEGTNYDIYSREAVDIIPTGAFLGGLGLAMLSQGYEGRAERKFSKFIKKYPRVSRAIVGSESIQAMGAGGKAIIPQNMSRLAVGARRVGIGGKRISGPGYRFAARRARSAAGFYQAQRSLGATGFNIRAPLRSLGGIGNLSASAGVKSVRYQMLRIAMGRAAKAAFNVMGLSWKVPLAIGAIKTAGTLSGKLHKKVSGLELGGTFVDTQGSYTERQRSLRAITSSRMSARAAIGGEAQLYHR